MIKVTIECSTGKGISEEVNMDGMDNSEDLYAILEVVQQAIYACGYRFKGNLEFVNEEDSKEED